MTDTNIESQGDTVSKRSYDLLKANRDWNADKVAKLEQENKELREALKVCIDELMYTSTTGHLWMWARTNEPVPDNLLAARKLLDK